MAEADVLVHGSSVFAVVAKVCEPLCESPM